MSTELLGARRLRELLERYGAGPKKSLGQNFVIDPNTIRKVVEVAAVGPQDRVLEIGAGCGSLTLGLAGAAQEVVAVEIDDRLIELLREVTGALSNVTLIHGDALDLDLGSFNAEALVGNLPYNIAALLVLRVLEEAPQIERLTVMTQREVGERLAAGPGSKAYGQTSVMVRFYGQASVAARVSRRAFFPEPNVDSVLLRIDRTPAADVDKSAFFDVVRQGFSQRRKMLRNALATSQGDPGVVERALSTCGLPVTARAEELDFEDFVRLTRALS